MCSSSLSDALNIDNKKLKEKMDIHQLELESIPNSFSALFWLYTHDFLYISASIEKVLGHSLEKFNKHGMVFFTSLIPEHRISHIYETMNTQASQIENHPEYIFAKEYLHIKAAVINSELQEVPVNYNAMLLDVKPFEPSSYLVLCSWIDISNKSESGLKDLLNEVREKLLEIRNLYIKSKPDHFKSLKYRNKISSREKEVALLLMKGHSTKNISDKLNITFNTVESHRKNLLEKLESKNTAELIHKLSYIPL